MSKRCLLVLSTFRYADEAVSAAFERAEDGLDVLYILGDATKRSVDHNVSAAGHLGTGPREDVEHALDAVHERMRDDRLDALRMRAEDDGVDLSIRQERGKFYELVQAAADEYERMVLVGPPRPFWRKLFGSKTTRLAEQLRARGLDVTLVEA